MDRDVASVPVLVSVALHVGVLVVSALSAPALGATERAGAAQETAYVLHQALLSVAEAETEDEPEPPPETLGSGENPRVNAGCGDHGGSMGEPTAAPRSRRYGVAGLADNPDPHVARAQGPGGWDDSITFDGWIGNPHGGDPDGPTIPWGRDDALGNDPRGARGNMWGDVIDVAFGSPGVGVGREELCAQCGESGSGMALAALPTAPGGATGTERAAGR
jgi:hypothetical protein